MSSHRKYSLNPNSRRKRRDQLNGFELWHYGPTWGPRLKTPQEIEEEKRDEAYEKAFKTWVMYLRNKGDNLSFKDIFCAPFEGDRYSGEYIYSIHYLLSAVDDADSQTDQAAAGGQYRKSVEEKKKLIDRFGENLFTYETIAFSDLSHDFKDSSYYRFRNIVQSQIVYMLNNEDKKSSPEFQAKQFEKEYIEKFSDNSDCGFFFYYNGFKIRFDVRAWGYLTGLLQLSNKKAGQLQDDFLDYVVDLITK